MKKIEVQAFSDIAEEVKRLDEAMQAISHSNLTRTAIVTLLRHATGENKGTIEKVLFGLENIGQFIKRK